ncbi:MAG: DNA polymerase III subunit delta', partial [Candidatus Hydrogenedentes bacterium]|nr:DNA polymerase III subunit delta' [Candidatus Hydrogenedentota bacterium]
MSFGDIRDQEIALRLLRNFIEQDRIPNGLLFWGPGGVGKQLAALEFAKALNCKGAQGDACGVCIACRKIAHGNHPDVRVLAPKDKSRLIKREEIDEVNEFAALRPF